MSHFARIDDDNIVNDVIVAEQDFIDTLPDKDKWLQTSYNTHGGVHDGGGTPLRMNYAGIGFTYDSARDAFIPPQQYSSWALDPSTCLWQPPVPMPTDGKMYGWDEATQSWVESTL